MRELRAAFPHLTPRQIEAALAYYEHHQAEVDADEREQDEDVHASLAQHLRARGYDALNCIEAGNDNRRLSDAWQLRYAAQDRRAILVHNIRDYVAHDQL